MLGPFYLTESFDREIFHFANSSPKMFSVWAASIRDLYSDLGVDFNDDKHYRAIRTQQPFSLRLHAQETPI